MADFTLSPNMSMPVPTVSEAPGPGWATNIDASLSIIDSHNHSAGQGVAITPAGLNINTDFPLNNNNATAVRSVNFTPQGTPLALPTDVGCIYVSGVDLYYNDENANQIRITQSGSVAGSAGTITGLPSGTASASFSAGTFTFQGATNTPAAMNVGPLIVGNAVLNSKKVSISPNSGIAANYDFTLPAALPAGLNYVTLDNSGNLAFNSAGFTGSDAVVLATSPTIATPTMTGVTTVSAGGIAFTSGTMLDFVEGTWIPTFTNISNTTTWITNLAIYQRVSNRVSGHIKITYSTSGGSASFRFSLPILPNNNFTANSGEFIPYGPPFGITVSATNTIVSTLLKEVTVSSTAPGAGSFNLAFAFSYLLNN